MITASDLHRLLQGFRFCTCCQKLEIPPDAQDYVTQCRGCYISLKQIPFTEQMERQCYCTDCGCDIPKEESSSTIARGGRVYRCRDCHKDAMAELPSSRRAALSPQHS